MRRGIIGVRSAAGPSFIDVVAIETMVVGFAELASAIRRCATVERDFRHPAVANVFNLRTVQREKPSPSLAISLRIVGEDVRSWLLAVPTAADRTNLNRVIEIQDEVRIALGLLDQLEDLPQRIPEFRRDWHLTAFLLFDS
jgi:hypothetical protein